MRSPLYALGVRFLQTLKIRTLEVVTSSVFPTATTTPTPTSGTGTFTSVSATIKSTDIGNRTFFTLNVSIVTNGTAATNVKVALPSTPATVGGCGGRETNSTGKGLSCLINTDGFIYISFYDGTYPGANGYMLSVNSQYDR